MSDVALQNYYSHDKALVNMVVFTAIALNSFNAIFITSLIAKIVLKFKSSGFILWLLVALDAGCISYTIGMSLWYVGVKALQEASAEELATAYN